MKRRLLHRMAMRKTLSLAMGEAGQTGQLRSDMEVLTGQKHW